MKIFTNHLFNKRFETITIIFNSLHNMNVKYNAFVKKASSFLGKKINKKIVVLESDDWGIMRAVDQKCLDYFLEKYGVSKATRWTLDTLETTEDLNLMYDLFQSYATNFINSPKLTANFITHNIDYNSSDELKFIPISEEFKNNNSQLLEKYKEGVAKNLFKPQLHGFSHFNTAQISNDFLSEEFQDNLKHQFPLAKTTFRGSMTLYRGEVFDSNFKENFIKAVQVFYETFGFYATTYIPPNYLYDFKWNKLLNTNHIELLQAASNLKNLKEEFTFNPFFYKNKNIINSTRNCRLDVHSDYNFLADQCIVSIEKNFMQKKPSIMDVHRVNFSGKFAPANRDKTLNELDKVFNYLKKNHPETVFMSSDELNTFFR